MTNQYKKDRFGFTYGDHLVVRKELYSHHGIYAGDGLVIHYSSTVKTKKNARVSETTLGNFSHGRSIHVIEHPNAVYSRHASVNRARKRLGEKEYVLLTNNCEHFVNNCIEGEHKSDQVENAHKIVNESFRFLFLDPPLLHNPLRPKRIGISPVSVVAIKHLSSFF